MEEIAAAASRKEAWQCGSKKESPLQEALEQPRVVAAIARQPQNYGTGRQAHSSGGSAFGYREHNRYQRPQYQDQIKKPCKDCGIRQHRGAACPAIGQKCNACHKVGHFMSVCRSRGGKIKEVRELKEDSEARGEEVKLLE